MTFATESSANDACENPNPFIDGRKANVNLAVKGAKPRAQGMSDTAASTISLGLSCSVPLKVAEFKCGARTLIVCGF